VIADLVVGHLDPVGRHDHDPGPGRDRAHDVAFGSEVRMVVAEHPVPADQDLAAVDDLETGQVED
jgi:hypothetical protein